MSSFGIDETSQEFKDENAFLHSSLTFSLARSTSISKVSVHEKNLDGRAAWFGLVSWFEDQGSEETISTKALAVITNNKLTANSHGGAEAFLEKFQQAILDLETLGQP